MSISESDQPKRKGRPPKPKAIDPAEATAALAAEMAWVREQEQKKIDQDRLIKARRIFADMWPFLDVELEILDTNLSASAKFGTLYVTAMGADAKTLNRDLKKWARYQLWQKERKDEMTAWAGSMSERAEWIELNIPLDTYKDSSGPHVR